MEQGIQEGNAATHWTRLSGHCFRASEVRWRLGVIASNLGKLQRRRTLPRTIQRGPLTGRQPWLFKTGGRFIRQARYSSVPLADRCLTRSLFGQSLGRIERLPWLPT